MRESDVWGSRSEVEGIAVVVSSSLRALFGDRNGGLRDLATRPMVKRIPPIMLDTCQRGAVPSSPQLIKRNSGVGSIQAAR
jgi:hypothetical protein